LFEARLLSTPGIIHYLRSLKPVCRLALFLQGGAQRLNLYLSPSVMRRNGHRRLQFIVLFFFVLVLHADLYAQALERANSHAGLEDRSLDLRPVEELEYEKALRQMRFQDINSVALHELSTIGSPLRDQHSTRTLGLQLDLFRSLAAYKLRRDI
jgi:hypothetical protein